MAPLEDKVVSGLARSKDSSDVKSEMELPQELQLS